jgi:hypothetical protein
MWLVSSRSFEPDTALHWDGLDWAVIPTPTQFHGWTQRQRKLVVPTNDGVFVHDGIRLWTYEWCTP